MHQIPSGNTNAKKKSAIFTLKLSLGKKVTKALFFSSNQKCWSLLTNCFNAMQYAQWSPYLPR